MSQQLCELICGVHRRIHSLCTFPWFELHQRPTLCVNQIRLTTGINATDILTVFGLSLNWQISKRENEQSYTREYFKLNFTEISSPT